jgi:transketolase
VITKEDGSAFFDENYVFAPGRADWLRRGDKATIITYGALTPNCMEAYNLLQKKEIAVSVLNMASLLPLDRESLLAAAQAGPILIVEDHHINTGLGASAALVFAEEKCSVTMQRLGVSSYSGSGKPVDLYTAQGLDPKSIATAVEGMLS